MLDLARFLWQLQFDERFQLLLTAAIFVTGVFTLLALIFGFRATYGRYANESSVSFRVPVQIAWSVQESPSFVWALYSILFLSKHWSNSLVVALFLAHYANRTLIFPFQLRSPNGTPVHLVLAAFTFCWGNGLLQAVYHSIHVSYAPDHFSRLSTLIGVALFLAGAAVNLHSDHILRNLRKPGETGHKIPHGGLFRFVSGANFLGECLEWSGFALVAATPVAWTFAFFTWANIGPRAWHHHLWYREKFDNYPKERRALIPFVL